MQQYFRGLSILQRQEGAAVVEYAFILPVLLFIIMGILEYSLVMYASAVLDGATFYAARVGSTGYVNAATTGVCPSPASPASTQSSAAYINCIAGTRVSGLLNASSLEISAQSYDGSFDNVGAPTFTTCTNTVSTPQTPPLCSENTGVSGGVTVYTISYPWHIFTPFLQNIIGHNGVFTINASAVVRNEPYSTSR